MPQAKDPICGMSVDTDRAKFKGTYGGETVYFCSAGCQKSYEASRGTPGAHPH